MLHDKATISQSLARGFDLCGRRGGGAAGGGAGERWSPATGPNSALLALGLAASRFPRRLPALLGILLQQAELSLRRAMGASLRVPGTALVEGRGVLCCPLGPAELPPPGACVRPSRSGGQAAEQREGDRISISSHRVTGGSACRRVGSFVVVFNPGTSNPFSDQRALPVLKDPGWGGGDLPPLGI